MVARGIGILPTVRVVGEKGWKSAPVTRGSWRSVQGRAALGLAVLLALYGNAFQVAEGITRMSLGGVVGGPLVGLGALAVAARGGGLELAAFGLHRRGLGPSLLWGLLLGLAMGLPGAAYLLRPDLAPVPVTHEAVRELGPLGLLVVVFGKILLATALPEELAFRGLLQARLRAVFGPTAAVLLGSLSFAAWHLLVNARTLGEVNLTTDPLLAVIAFLGQLLAVFVGGLAFALLRERTGNLAGPILAHWLVDTLFVGALYFAP